MHSEITLSDVLRVEDAAEVLAFRCPDTGIPLWTAIRAVYLRLIIGELLYGAPIVDTGGVLGSRSRLKTVATIARAFAHNGVQRIALRGQYPVVLIASGARLIQVDGKYFNCLSEYFAGAAPDRTFPIEDMFNFRWPFPRRHPRMLLQTPLRVSGQMRARLRAKRFRAPARALVALVSQRAFDLLGWHVGEERRQWLETMCANGAASFLPRYQAYHAIFRRTGARLLLKEEACYGGPDNASAILAARDMGMVTAEFQHGAITAGHDAYNFAPALLADPACRKILPDHLLMYGNWWGGNVNAPVHKVAIGNPHRSETIDFSVPLDAPRRQLLVLGDGIETHLYLELSERLADALEGEVEVVFRPHPRERAAILARNPGGLIGGVRIDGNQDIFMSFQHACAVVSEASTGLFDAIGLVPRIYIWDTPKARFTFPHHQFQSFVDANDLLAMVRDPGAGRISEAHSADVWAPHWQQNYLDFLEKAIRP